MKIFKRCLIGIVVVIVIVPLMLFGIVYSVFWRDAHTYFDMNQCTLEQSQEIFDLMDLELYDGITINHVSYHLAPAPDSKKELSFELYGNERDLTEYMQYLELNNIKEHTQYSCSLSSLQLNETKDILSFHYVIVGRSNSEHLTRYIREHGTENIKFNYKNLKDWGL